jgi:DNA-binding Lrp family transcriptional regulator
MNLTELDRAVIAATQGGLPLVTRPYEALGAMLGVSGDEVRECLARMLAEGLVRRIGVVVKDAKDVDPASTAEAMSAWDVDDASVEVLGERIGSHFDFRECSRHARSRPHWPYNLLVTLHGASRIDIEQQAAQIAALLGHACRSHEILYARHR